MNYGVNLLFLRFDLFLLHQPDWLPIIASPKVGPARFPPLQSDRVDDVMGLMYATYDRSSSTYY